MLHIESDDLFQIPYIFEQEIIPDQIQIDHDHNLILLEKNNLSSKDVAKKRQKKACVEQGVVDEDDNESKLRKIIHRDVERQRRQEMANLCSSLRSLLPPGYIKGKRSTWDHMQEAVNYINDMQKKMKEMKNRRDMLQKCHGSSDSPNSVEVKLCRDNGVEILMSSNLKNKEIPLSRVINQVVERGLNVINSVSTKSDDKSFHRIHSQLQASVDFRCTNLSLLQQRVANLR